MFNEHFILIVLILITILFIFYYFKAKNKRIKDLHFQKVLQLNRSISKEEQQILIRHFHLDKYHLLRYNLGESLLVQPQIKVN